MRRRELLAGAAAVALARPATAGAQAAREGETLSGLLRIEHTSVFAYDHVLAAGHLADAEPALARTLREHEARHVEVLTESLAEMGWTLPRPPRAIEAVEVPQVRAALDAAGDRVGARAALEEVARLSEEVYRLALGRLRGRGHIQLGATILAAEASHLVAWRTVR